MTRTKALLAIVTAAGLAYGCGSIPYRTARNLALCDNTVLGQQAFSPDACLDVVISRRQSSAAVPRARSEFDRDDPDVPKAFVGLSISGGGSRAANFGLAVLEQLDLIGLLKHVTAISTTSGGGLAGAYYALKGPEIDWRHAADLMATDFRSKWLFASLRPDNLLTTSLTHQDRSDLMADIFDDVLFDRQTYSRLGALRPGYPIFLANATALDSGARFTFSDENFRGKLVSRLDQFPLSQAVVASAAFPGVFNSVTLREYSLLDSPNSVNLQENSTYLHLYDGGPADNLGIESLVALANTHQDVWQAKRPPGAAPAPCAFILVDAFPVGVTGKSRSNPDPRGWFDHALDLNMFAAFDSLLMHRRSNLLVSVGLAHEFDEGYRGLESPYIGELPVSVSLGDLGHERLKSVRQVVEVDLPMARLRNEGTPALPRPVGVKHQTLREIHEGVPPDPIPLAADHFRCTVWHINLSGTLDVKPFVGSAGENPRRLRIDNDDRRNPVLEYRARLKRLVSQIDTDFRLSGPRNCKSTQLQDALYAAAFVLTREDHASRSRMCDWFADAGFSVSSSCRSFPGNESLSKPVTIRPAGARSGGQPVDSSVDCVSEPSADSRAVVPQ